MYTLSPHICIFDLGLLTMNLSVVRNPLPAVNHIRLRIDNFNIEDIFDRVNKLKKLFRNRLEPVTYHTSTIQVYRMRSEGIWC